MRVVNKEHKVCKCEVLVPTFTSKKDNVSGTVVAYMVNINLSTLKYIYIFLLIFNLK